MIGKEKIWKWLEEVSDPEIPVLSVVDLGVVREVITTGSHPIVKITPTYSGCPAMKEIEENILDKLKSEGLENAEVQTILSPPWTTDWMTDAGRAKLEAYGIAPPRPAGCPQHCPHCKSQAVERISQFGSTPCKAQWRCQDCLEPFDYFKCI